MEVVVRYSETEVITEVQIPIDADKRNVISVDKNGVAPFVKFESIDEAVAFSVAHTMSKSDLREYIQLLQKIIVKL